MKLHELTNELLLLIADYLPGDVHVNRFSRTSKHLYYLLNPYSYRINAKYNKSSALFFAVNHCNIDIARRALDQRANCNLLDKKYLTPLALAAWKGDEEMVRLLLAQDDLDFNAPTMHGSALNCAILRGATGAEAVVKLLLSQNGIQADAQDYSGTTPLLHAINPWSKAPQIPIVRLLLSRNDVDVNVMDRVGTSPLMLAISCGHAEIVQLLLGKEGIHVKGLTNGYGFTPLAQAADGGYIDIMQMLLDRDDVDINERMVNGASALITATRKKRADIISLLLERPDIDVSVGDHKGRTALRWAATMGHESAVKKMLELGASPWTRDRRNSTPLHCAATQGHKGIVEIILNCPGGEILAQDIYGRTARSRAEMNKQMEISALLLEAEMEQEANEAQNKSNLGDISLPRT